MANTEHETARAWLQDGFYVRKWTSGGGDTLRCKLRLERVGTSPAAGGSGGGAGGAGGSGGDGNSGTAAMQRAFCFCVKEDTDKGGLQDGGAQGWDGEDGAWALVLQSDNGKDVVHSLCDLQEVRPEGVVLIVGGRMRKEVLVDRRRRW